MQQRNEQRSIRAVLSTGGRGANEGLLSHASSISEAAAGRGQRNPFADMNAETDAIERAGEAVRAAELKRGISSHTVVKSHPAAAFVVYQCSHTRLRSRNPFLSRR